MNEKFHIYFKRHGGCTAIITKVRIRNQDSACKLKGRRVTAVCGDDKLWMRAPKSSECLVLVFTARTSGASWLSSCWWPLTGERETFRHRLVKGERFIYEQCVTHRAWGQLVRRHTGGWSNDRWCRPSRSLKGLWRDSVGVGWVKPRHNFEHGVYLK